eukprot:681884-Alexandrium_andersonii.AAC.1
MSRGPGGLKLRALGQHIVSSMGRGLGDAPLRDGAVAHGLRGQHGRHVRGPHLPIKGTLRGASQSLPRLGAGGR